jgi:hypothetical protein
MWIRSQNKLGLIDAKNIQIGKVTETEQVRYELSEMYENIHFLLGLYGTETRAIEVLDMIQNRIYDIEFLKTHPEQGHAGAIFEMPEE